MKSLAYRLLFNILSPNDNFLKYKRAAAGAIEETATGRKVLEIMYGIQPVIVLINKENERVIRDSGYPLRELANQTKGIIIPDGLRAVLKQIGTKCYPDIDETKMFDHYFRHIYRILKFVHDPNKNYLSFDDKYEYTSLLRAILSPYELIWIYYNCVTGAGNPKLKELVERYSLLKNLRRELLERSKEFLDEMQGQEYGNLNDYYHYSTHDVEDDNKIYIGAFYNKTELIEIHSLELKEIRNIK